jgi:Fe2+ or Zn2+ uptake regulation protein
MITKMRQERITNQKKIILEYLESVKTHPSAEVIFREIRKKLPRISRGTVYRILNNLNEKNEIQKIPDEVSHYDGDVSSHTHFICEKCNKIFDIFDVCKGCSVLRRRKTKVGRIRHYQINFYGNCKKCSKK